MSFMQLEITKETSERLVKVSKELGMEKKEFVERALLLYLDQMNKLMQLLLYRTHFNNNHSLILLQCLYT